MKEKDKLRLMEIATIFTQLQSFETINGEKDLAMIKVSRLNQLGEEIKDIITRA